ncbi:hypothetical protein [Paraburkholderia sp. SIMBA_054]|uniref:hypothetical protein n=1 Tax=Paraburkholderia sp. SIMBA_054 TaxID=3085795 RepID=UPI003977FD1F
MSAPITKLPATVSGTASLIRPSFSAGLLLQDDDLTQIVAYVRDMSRRFFRTLFGCGVMCGFEITSTVECGKLKIVVGQGLALDCEGDIIELRQPQTIEIDPTCGLPIPPEVWISICHKERSCAPRDVLCSDTEGDTASTATRIREGYEIQLLAERPKCVCGCCERKAHAEDEPKPEDASANAEDEREGQREGFLARPRDPCYSEHYAGKCACDCECECVLLARLSYVKGQGDVASDVAIDYDVRRFVRPALIRDPLAGI